MSYRNILIFNRILERKVISGIIAYRQINRLLWGRLLRGRLLVHRLLRLETGP